MGKQLESAFPQRKRVAVLLALEGHRGRGMLRGILRYMDTVRGWEMRQRFADFESCEVAQKWHPDGIIVNAPHQSMIDSLKRSGLPVVNVSGRQASQPFPQILADNYAIGRMAADYFLAKGYRNFAWLADVGSAVAEDRGKGFRERLAEKRLVPAVSQLPDDEGVFDRWELADQRLEEWLRLLPKPVAIFTDDYRGPMLIRTCRRLGELVPEQVAMLGVDNDELQCRQADPPLSSIQVPHEEIGYNAAQLLDSLMNGGAAPPEPMRIKPIGVVTRASTDILAIEDAHVAAAVRFINQNAHRRINVADVVKALAIGRRVLEYRFRRAMGRSLLDEIHRVCAEQAKMLLVNTNKPLPDVAVDAGFRDNQHLWTVFRKLTGVSPAAYRRSQRS